MPVHPQRKFDLSDESVCEALRAARHGAGYELRDLAEAAGIDWRVLSRIERGERPCRVTEMVALSAATYIDPETVLQAALGDKAAMRKLNNYPASS